MGDEPVAAPAEESKPEKPLWNSLEITRVIVSAITPLMIFGLGVLFTLSSNEKADRRNKDGIELAFRREQAARQDATRREAAAREEARKREDKIIDDARKNAERAQQIAFRQERDMRAEGYARDDRLRAMTLRENRAEKVLDRRREIWEKVGPLLTQVDSLVSETRSWRGGPKSREEINRLLDDVRRLNGEARNLIEPYESYFSAQFMGMYERFNWSLHRFVLIEMAEDAGIQSEPSFDKRKGYREFAQASDALQFLVREELSRIEGGDAAKAIEAANRMPMRI